MNPTTSLTREEWLADIRSKADDAARTGTITRAERDALLHWYVGTTNATSPLASDHDQRDQASVRRTVSLIVGVGLLIGFLVVVLFYATGNVTGAVTLDTPLNTTSDTGLTNATSSNLTGEEGTANETNSTVNTTNATETNSTMQVSASDPPPGNLTNATSMNLNGEEGTTNETNTNATANRTVNNANPNETNSTLHVPSVSALAPSDCTDPDPNKRPLDCLQGNNSTYFLPEEILLKDKDAVTVGRLTPIGNLFITGSLVEHSTGTPHRNDYQLGYTNEDGDFVPTVWIDSATGDLHLRGHLTEANGNIVVSTGQAAITNQQGIVLALLNDSRAGDLVVRGNIIPHHRSVA